MSAEKALRTFMTTEGEEGARAVASAEGAPLRPVPFCLTTAGEPDSGSALDSLGLRWLRDLLPRRVAKALTGGASPSVPHRSRCQVLSHLWKAPGEQYVLEDKDLATSAVVDQTTSVRSGRAKEALWSGPWDLGDAAPAQAWT